MSKKNLLAKMHKQLEETKDTSEKKTIEESTPKKEKEEKAPLEAHVPRGERADFLKITLTIPGDLLTELRALGMRRKAAKMKDTDTSALIREAVVDFLHKHRSN